jgi:hypothetical protein
VNNTQLYLVIGLPILAQLVQTAILILYINAKGDALKEALLRVEGVLDARLKHLEDKR